MRDDSCHRIELDISNGTLSQAVGLGYTFANATVLTAGVSFNDLEFPPHSGNNLITDVGGPISISFANPVLLFDGYFTYSTGITLTAFDAAGNEVAQTISTFLNNEGLSGDPHSSPNEYLYLSSPVAISRIIIIGGSTSGSFVMHDLRFVTETIAVPEPTTSFIMALLIAGLGHIRRRSRARSPNSS